jgi:hypothetical protein
MDRIGSAKMLREELAVQADELIMTIEHLIAKNIAI